MTRRSDESGFVATELVLGIGLLVLPVALLVLTLPGWSERQVTRARHQPRGRPAHRARRGVRPRFGPGARRHHGRATSVCPPPTSRSSCRAPTARPGPRLRRRGARHRAHARGGASRSRRGRRLVVDRASPGAGRPVRGTGMSRRAESGTVTLWLLGLCLMLFALGGISLDLWRAFSERRALAATADAAALAGASAIDEARYRASGTVLARSGDGRDASACAHRAPARSRRAAVGQRARRHGGGHGRRARQRRLHAARRARAARRLRRAGHRDRDSRGGRDDAPCSVRCACVCALVHRRRDAVDARRRRADSGDGELGPDYVRATAPIWARAPSPVAVSRARRRPRSRRTSGSGRRPAGGASCSRGRSRPRSLPSVTPLPGIVVFPVRAARRSARSRARRRARSGSTAPRRCPPGRRRRATFVVDTATPRDGGPGVFVVPRCALPGCRLPPEPPTAAEIWQQTPLPRATVHASPPGTRAWPGIVNLESRFWTAAARRRPCHRGPRRLRGRRRRPPGRVRVGVRRRHDVGVVGTRRARRARRGRRSAGGATTTWCST